MNVNDAQAVVRQGIAFCEAVGRSSGLGYASELLGKAPAETAQALPGSSLKHKSRVPVTIIDGSGKGQAAFHESPVDYRKLIHDFILF